MLEAEKPVTSKRDFCKILFLSLSFPRPSVIPAKAGIQKKMSACFGHPSAEEWVSRRLGLWPVFAIFLWIPA